MYWALFNGISHFITRISYIIYFIILYWYIRFVLYLLKVFHHQKIPENPLTEEMLADNLSLLCKTGNGLAHAYVRLDIHDKWVWIYVSRLFFFHYLTEKLISCTSQLVIFKFKGTYFFCFQGVNRYKHSELFYSFALRGEWWLFLVLLFYFIHWSIKQVIITSQRDAYQSHIFRWCLFCRTISVLIYFRSFVFVAELERRVHTDVAKNVNKYLPTKQ